MRKINWESLSKAFYTELSFFHLIQIYSISHSTSQKKRLIWKTPCYPLGRRLTCKAAIGQNIIYMGKMSMAVSTKELRMLKASELLTHLALLDCIFSLQLRTLVYHSNYEFIDTTLPHFSRRTSILPTPHARLLCVAGKHCVRLPCYKRNMSHGS